MAGPALSPRVLASLAAAGIKPTGWQWAYRPSIARRTAQFPPHRTLAGKFSREPEFDCSGSFHGGKCWPDDHHGCLCQIIPVLRGPDGRFAPRRTE